MNARGSFNVERVPRLFFAATSRKYLAKLSWCANHLGWPNNNWSTNFLCEGFFWSDCCKKRPENHCNFLIERPTHIYFYLLSILYTLFHSLAFHILHLLFICILLPICSLGGYIGNRHMVCIAVAPPKLWSKTAGGSNSFVKVQCQNDLGNFSFSSKDPSSQGGRRTELRRYVPTKNVSEGVTVWGLSFRILG